MGQMVKSPMNRLQKNLMNLHGNLRGLCFFFNVKDSYSWDEKMRMDYHTKTTWLFALAPWSSWGHSPSLIRHGWEKSSEWSIYFKASPQEKCVRLVARRLPHERFSKVQQSIEQKSGGCHERFRCSEISLPLLKDWCFSCKAPFIDDRSIGLLGNSR